MSSGCHVCDDFVLRRWVDEEQDKGTPFTQMSRLAGLRGYPVSSGVISRHCNENHRRDYEGVTKAPKVAKRDASAIIKDRLLNAIEAIPEDSSPEWIDGVDGERVFIPGRSILDKELQPALNTALKAQAIEDRREQKKPQQNFWIELFVSQQEATPLLEEGTMIDGEATEVA